MLNLFSLLEKTKFFEKNWKQTRNKFDYLINNLLYNEFYFICLILKRSQVSVSSRVFKMCKLICLI